MTTITEIELMGAEPQVEKRLGVAAAELALNEINVLFCAASESRVIYVVEYKWWYGNGPSDSRWQRVSISLPSDLGYNWEYHRIAYRVKEIREALAAKTGVSQNVRH